jgi:hypothetical protein
MQTFPQISLDPTRRALLLMALTPLVHLEPALAAPPVSRTKEPAKTGPAGNPGASDVILGHGTDNLPPAVADMRSAILSAVETGDISDLKMAIELNELKPDFGQDKGQDPIAHLKSRSGDGQGREMLAVLSRLLEAGWAAIPGGRDIENNRIYVWPWFAEVPLDKLTPVQEVALYRLITPAEAKAMREAKRWTWWRLSIGADGVWHTFLRMK